MKKKILIAIPLAMTVMFSGCATILSGTHQQIGITSTPPHQKVTIGSQTIITPSVVSVKRSDKSLIVKSKNCDDQRLLVPKINPVFFVNILSGGVFGSTTDYATHSMWKYNGNVHLNCQK